MFWLPKIKIVYWEILFLSQFLTYLKFKNLKKFKHNLKKREERLLGTKNFGDEFEFIRRVNNGDIKASCLLCSSKFSISKGGCWDIAQHIT